MSQVRKIRIGRRTTRADLASAVTSALEREGDHPILVGGAVVDIYTQGRYRSDDLDIITYKDKEKIAEVMHALDFYKKGMHWQHPNTELMIQFLSPPAMVGAKHIRSPHRYRAKPRSRSGSRRSGARSRSGVEIPMYSALDSACDRLAWAMEGEQQSFRQCVDVIVKQRVSLGAVSRWLAGEGWTEDRKRQVMTRLRAAVMRRRKMRK